MPLQSKELSIQDILQLIQRLEYYKSQAHVLINTKIMKQKQVDDPKKLSNLFKQLTTEELKNINKK